MIQGGRRSLISPDSIDMGISSSREDLSAGTGTTEKGQGFCGNLAWRIGLKNSSRQVNVEETCAEAKAPEPETRGRSENVNLAWPGRTVNPSQPRSFFSDDSSQIRQESGLRKRISSLRSKLPASRVPVSLSKEVVGLDSIINQPPNESDALPFSQKGRTTASCKDENTRTAPGGFRLWVSRAKERIFGVRRAVSGGKGPQATPSEQRPPAI